MDAETRLQWLNSRMPPKVATPPKVAASPKVGFRTNPQVVGKRSVEAPSSESRPAPVPPAETRPAESSSVKPSPAELTPSKTRVTDVRLPKSTPAPLARPIPPTVAKEPPPTKGRAVQIRSTPVPKPTLTPALAAIPSTKPAFAKPQLPASVPSAVKSRYPWKTGIVTTVFWIGERPSGNNFTPNRSSSWDVRWMENYGGFDNPNPAARRNFIPTKFTPRQNPFYVALPYNDVTRGTTKPEARRVIPWFKEEFEREGQSVCRNRWVAVRNRAGKTVYAQWSDCGPFRTDHWEYVFGNAKPKPNLNKGAGLDVSPAVRDCLGIDNTDVTDWKFVDFKDVPSGPWARYGDNNTFVLKDSRPAKSTAKGNGQRADSSARNRSREL